MRQHVADSTITQSNTETLTNQHSPWATTVSESIATLLPHGPQRRIALSTRGLHTLGVHLFPPPRGQRRRARHRLACASFARRHLQPSSLPQLVPAHVLGHKPRAEGSAGDGSSGSDDAKASAHAHHARTPAITRVSTGPAHIHGSGSSPNRESKIGPYGTDKRQHMETQAGAELQSGCKDECCMQRRVAHFRMQQGKDAC